MSFAEYFCGILILIGGSIYGAADLGVSGMWIAVCAIIALGASVLAGAAVTFHRSAA